MTDFQKLVQSLEQAKVPCNVKLFKSGSISVECGFNWPDEMFDQISAYCGGCGCTCKCMCLCIWCASRRSTADSRRTKNIFSL
jgi:hypothetical protein